jgi:hypothetical protein
MRRTTLMAIGFLAFAFSLLSVTKAQAECQEFGPNIVPICPQGWSNPTKLLDVDPGAAKRYRYTCCTTHSEPYATGESAAEREARFKTEAAKLKADCEAQGKQYDPATTKCTRPIKQMGKDSPTGKAALKNACDTQNWIWDEKTGHCKKPSTAKADCEAKGSSYHYDMDTQRCVGGMTKKQNAPEQASDAGDDQPQNKSDDEENQPKKKKKKHRND